MVVNIKMGQYLIQTMIVYPDEFSLTPFKKGIVYKNTLYSNKIGEVQKIDRDIAFIHLSDAKPQEVKLERIDNFYTKILKSFSFTMAFICQTMKEAFSIFIQNSF